MRDEHAQFQALFLDTRGSALTYLTRRAPTVPPTCSEGYLIAWRRRADLPSGDERRLWLYGVARRLVAEHHRHSLTRVHAQDIENADSMTW